MINQIIMINQITTVMVVLLLGLWLLLGCDKKDRLEILENKEITKKVTRMTHQRSFSAREYELGDPSNKYTRNMPNILIILTTH